MLTAVRDIVHPYIGYMHTSITRAVRPGVNGRGSSDAGACSKPRMMVHVGDKTHACMHADTLCAYGKQYDYPAKWKREHIRIQSLARGRDRTVKESWHARHGRPEGGGLSVLMIVGARTNSLFVDVSSACRRLRVAI